MAVGLVFGGLWLGIGVTMWWWPVAIFVAFSSDDVTPGARAFAVGAMFIGAFFLTLEYPVVPAALSVPATVSLVGVLLLVEPVPVRGVSDDGPVTPRRAGLGLLASGVVLGALVVV